MSVRKRLTSLLLGFVMSTALLAEGQNSLPPKVQADLLKTQAVDAVGKGNSKGFLDIMDKYRLLRDSSGEAIPPALLFYEATIAKNLQEPIRAITSLEEYFKTATEKDPKYQEAIKMYSTLESDTSVKAHFAARHAKQEIEMKKQEIEIKRVADEKARVSEKRNYCMSLIRRFESTSDKEMFFYSALAGPTPSDCRELGFTLPPGMK